MYLKKLGIIGFKSFMEKTSLDFLPGITAVVGPNGSGKSNIADAVRWALGEQSAQRLRGGKMEDIIFSGTENRRPLQYAEVSLLIDNADKQMPLDYEEIKVSRRVYRSGESEFSINGAPCRLKDIHELFMDTGVGREGYSVIAQGKIDEILSAKSQDRRLLFEEAAGIVKFKNRKQDALSKLEKERANLERVNDIISEVESRLEPLKEQSDAARQFLSLTERLKIVQVNIFLREAAGFEDKLNALNSTVKDLEQSIADADNVSKATQAELDALKASRSEDELKSKRLAAELSQITIEIEKRENDKQLCANKKTHLEKDLQRLEQQIEKTRTDTEAKQNVKTGYVTSVQSLEAKQSELQKELSDLERNFDLFAALLRESEEKLDKHNARIMDCMQKISDSRSALEKLSAHYEQLNEKKEQCLNKAAELESALMNDGSRLTELKQSVDNIQAQAAEKAEQLKFYENETVTLKDKAAAKQEELSALNKQYDRARGRLKVLRELEQRYEGYYNSVKVILQKMKEEPHFFPGVCGIISELISVKPEYETAVNAALGSLVQNIITKTEDDAKTVIEFLKSTRSGRATFLPLNTVKPKDFGSALDNIRSQRGFVNIAKNLITYDAMYENIFANILGRVIVADTFSNARDMARAFAHAHKIVTLDGELFNPGGAITGGAENKMGGALFARAREIAELTTQTEELRTQRAALESDLETITEKRRLSRLKTDELKDEIKQRELAAAALNEQHAALLNSIEKRNIRLNELNAEDTEVTAEIITVNKQMREESANTVSLEHVLSDIKNEFANEQERLAQSREEKDVKIKHITDIKIEIASISEKQLNAEANIERLKAEIERNLADITKYENEITVNLKKSEALDAQTKELIIKKQELAALYASTEEEYKKNEQNSAEETETEKELSEKLRDKQDELSALKNEHTRQTLRKEQAEQEIKRLYDLMWDEYELTYTTAKEYERKEKTAKELSAEEHFIKASIRELGAVNIAAIEDYKTSKARHDFLTAQRDDIIKAEQSLKQLIKELTSLMEEQFKTQLAVISENFKLVFSEMFGGGTAAITLTDENNILESGIEITAQPPGKKLQIMSLLSGGERSLTAMSLLFSILRMKPSPFCVLDEIDAALDDANVARFTRFLKKYSSSTQFILITHKKGTMTEANSLYGVTMHEKGISTLVSVELS